MTIITKLRHSKKLPKAGSTAVVELPPYPHELLNQLNDKTNSNEADKLKTFKLDFLNWTRDKNPNVLEWNLAQQLILKLQEKYPTLNREKLQHIIALSFKADLNAEVVSKNLQKLGATLTMDEFNALFLAALNTLEFNDSARYLAETAANYSHEVIEFGIKLLQAAVFYGQQKELIHVAEPEIKLALRNKNTVIVCTFKGPLGVRQNSTFELIPLHQPFEVIMQWRPKSGWIFHLPHDLEYKKLYEHLGIMAMVKFSSAHKKEMITGLAGLSLTGVGLFLQDIDAIAMGALYIVGGLAIVISGISSCIKCRGAANIDSDKRSMMSEWQPD